MAQNVICAESELSKAANKISVYAEFLSTSIESYIKILSDMQGNGISDDLICARLTELASNISPYRTKLTDQSSAISSYIKKYISNVESADDFAFPESITSSIASIVAKLL